MDKPGNLTVRNYSHGMLQDYLEFEETLKCS